MIFDLSIRSHLQKRLWNVFGKASHELNLFRLSVKDYF